MTCPIIFHSFLSRFVTDDLLLNKNYALKTTRNKPRETEMDFAERIHDIARCCGNLFSNADIRNVFKQDLLDDTHALLENNRSGLTASTRHDLGRVKQCAVTAGTAVRSFQAL